jgi:hypothetical protein
LSNGDNKPGLRDIRSLRERLGMLNKGNGQDADPSAPSGPAPASDGSPVDPRADLISNPESLAGLDTAVVKVRGRETDHTEEVAPSGDTPARPRGPSGPASPQAPNSLGGFDVFSRVPEESVAAPSSAGAGVQSDIAAFANPLQVGHYSAASAPVTMNADDQATLDAYEKSSRGVSGKLVLAIALIIGSASLVFGYMGNSVLQERRFVNAQISATVDAKTSIDLAFKTVDEIQALVKGFKPGQIDFEGTKRLSDKLSRLDAGAILASRFPLSKEIAPLMAKFVADANQLIDEAAKHRRYTLDRDKKSLEAIRNGLGPLQGKQLVLLAIPPDPAKQSGPNVELVAIVSQKPIIKKVPIPGASTTKKGKKFTEVRLFKVLDRNGATKEVPGERLLTISQNHLFADGQANVMAMYSQRVLRLQFFASEIDKYEANFKKTLTEQASRPLINTYF